MIAVLKGHIDSKIFKDILNDTVSTGSLVLSSGESCPGNHAKREEDFKAQLSSIDEAAAKMKSQEIPRECHKQMMPQTTLVSSNGTAIVSFFSFIF